MMILILMKNVSSRKQKAKTNQDNDREKLKQNEKVVSNWKEQFINMFKIF